MLKLRNIKDLILIKKTNVHQYEETGLPLPLSCMKGDLVSRRTLNGENAESEETRNIAQIVYNMNEKAAILLGNPNILESFIFRTVM